MPIRLRDMAPIGGVVATALALAGCVPTARQAAPAPPPPVATPPAPPADWRDLPLTPGRWTYLPSGSRPSAQFVRPGVSADFAITCDRTAKAVILFRAGRTAAAPAQMTITTSYSAQSLAAQTAADGVSVTLPATSDVLDRFAFSRGHVSIAVAGLPLLVLPAWAEPARVIEDCRA